MRVRKTVDTDAPGIGARIKEARMADQRSFTAICAAAGMTTANWYKIETEQHKVLRAETLSLIEKTLNINFGVTFDD